MNTGKAEYLPVPRRDEHFLLLQATCAMPLLFPVYHLDGMPCLDGGAADAIPYERAFEMGCDRVSGGSHPGAELPQGAGEAPALYRRAVQAVSSLLRDHAPPGGDL
ncbi:MAG: hypothetical protein ACLSAF_02620 [Intestinimonas sp.]